MDSGTARPAGPPLLPLALPGDGLLFSSAVDIEEEDQG